MDISNKKIILWVILAILIVGGIYISRSYQTRAGELDAFASCLKDQGAVFYGTFWCPYCQNQKKIFGRSEKFLPYVECSTPDGRGQLPVCNEKNITGYPTWVFASGERMSGEIPLETLSEKTGCPLP